MNPQAITAYLREIEQQLATGRATEHTHRPALQRLIEAARKKVVATNEPARVACGAPDFIVARDGVTVGYVEAKDIGTDLKKLENDEQLLRYREGLPNLLLTDYLNFRLYQAGNLLFAIQLAEEGPGNRIKPSPTAAEDLERLWEFFFAGSIPPIATPNELAERMAATARLLKTVIARALAIERDKHGELHAQLAAFRRVLLHDLEAEQFADMYAQTICYGLFAARCNHKENRGAFTREAAVFEIPETNPFLREMFVHIAGPKLDTRLAWAVDHLAQLLARTDIAAILKDFGKRTRREDPVVHFYESFLAAYDPRMREMRGVYYTPEPVVSFIVRSVDEILKNDFGIRDGLAATGKIDWKTKDANGKEEIKQFHKVLILDPAVGTGTFLHGVVDQIHETVAARRGKGAWNGYVPEHLLPRLFGFELLMAPYAVAHMKLGIQLAELGYKFQSGERLRVYLTNTLEEAIDAGLLPPFAATIANEASGAAQVKKEFPVMVVLGNPPYSGHSANTGDFISKLMRGIDPETGQACGDYFRVDGQPLGERNPKWLNDDYVKFIRFAQWRIERTGYGILAFISNHGYLDNPTFRGMRQCLMETFDDIYLLDLHGNAKKKETAPDGGEDKNVFDIQQGVAIGIFVKHNRVQPKKAAAVHHADLWGPREVYADKARQKLVGGKYRILLESDIRSTKWTTLRPASPNYLFIPQDKKKLGEYEKGWKLTDVFPVNSVGIVTARDHLSIHWSPEEVWSTVKSFIAMPPEEARKRFQLGEDVQDWKVHWAQEDVKSSGPMRKSIAPILYRPFDQRWTYYTGRTKGLICRPRPEVMRHMLAGENLGLLFMRQVALHDVYSHSLVTNMIVDNRAMYSNKGILNLAPLYLYANNGDDADDIEVVAAREEAAFYGIRRRPNLSAEFIVAMTQALKLSFVAEGCGDLKKTFGPEDVFHYIYAVLHAPTYRARYAQFLKLDFPRVPLTANRKLFRALCKLGARLCKLHLLEEESEHRVLFPVDGTAEVQRIVYTPKERRVHINATQYFQGISPAAWEFHVGGYQVCEKWLKDRKGRSLSFEEIATYGKIVGAISETLTLMEKIDAAVAAEGGWPLG